ncbi:YfjI family protein [Planctellipticum variicoloris]|uniref:YfjI family protein n=1 Tax=Planctellipticum variicoloris TaxID=3064265 RepID=UPI0030132AC5|nr:YfjI family protein [Planctomycetaceae bacterium SH412]
MTRNIGHKRERARAVVCDVRALAEQRLLAAICAEPNFIEKYDINADWFTDPARRTTFQIMSRYHRDNLVEFDLSPELLVLFASKDPVLAEKIHREGDAAPPESVSEGIVRNLTDEGWHWKSLVDQLVDAIRGGLTERMATEETAKLLQTETDPERQAEGLEQIAAKIRSTATGNAVTGLHKPRSDLDIDASVTADHPFPEDMLPPVLRRYARSAAWAIGCDVSLVGAPLLVAAAGAIGISRAIQLKRSWIEFPILWMVILAESGGHKSPALEKVLQPTRAHQKRKLQEFLVAWEQYEIELTTYERDLAEWKRSKQCEVRPDKPAEPRRWRGVFDDATLEAAIGLLADNPRGLLLACDELAGWIGGLDRYKAGSSDAPKWLEMHGGRMVILDRKTGDRKMVMIPRAAISIIGGSQPATWRRLMTPERQANGMEPRFLTLKPCRRPKRWTEADVSPSDESLIAGLFDRLYDLQPQTDEESGELSPKLVALSSEAKRLFVEWYDRHADEQSELTGSLCSTWSKLEAYAPRLALVHHMVRVASGDNTVIDPQICDAISMEAGIALADWFGREAKRINVESTESPEEAERRELVELIRARNGAITVRKLMQCRRRYRKSAHEARSALTALVKAGLGRWHTEQTGGAPLEQFILLETGAVTEAEQPPENETSVTVLPCHRGDEAEAEVGTRYLDEDEIDRLESAFAGYS